MAEIRAFLDYNAGAPLLPAAREALVAALGLGNPSSVHAEGREARKAVEDARRSVAALVGAKPEHVVFTSGATEGAAMLLTPRWRMGRAPLKASRLYISAAEHPCVLSGGQFAGDELEILPVDGDGVLDLGALESALAAHDREAGLPLVAVHAANNETGVVQPIEAMAALVKRAGGIFVLDAAQAGGRIPLDVSSSSADFLILSSHKIGGPKGVGAIAGRSDLMMPEPLIRGGGQEKGFRAGTENVAGIVGFGAAACEAGDALDEAARIAALRDRIEQEILSICPDAVIYGRAAPQRLPNTSFFGLPGIKPETAQIAFDLAGVALSAGSACSSGKVGPSHVLKAMGYGDGAGALRVSIGRATTEDEIALFSHALADIVARKRGARDRAA